MKLTLPRRGRYTGRLAFDGEYHIDPKGRRVVTLDEGKTWRYARRKDTPHNARYQRRSLEVKSTAVLLVEIAAESGPAVARDQILRDHPHHYEVQPHDPHYAEILSHADAEAATKTSHTEAWA